MHTYVKGACITGNVPLQCDGWTCRHYKMLPDNKSEILLPKSSRATQSIHNWVPCMPTVQERQKFNRPLKKRVNINVPAMTKISMDIKHMPASHGYLYILVLLCEVSNYMVALPLHSTRTPHILQVFQKGYVAYFGPPTHIVCDQDASFTSSLMHAFTE